MQHRETLKAVFQIYFRILKNMQSSPALAATLQGLARYTLKNCPPLQFPFFFFFCCCCFRFTHLINVEFFNDLMAVLKSLAFLQSTDLECALSAILTTFQLAQRFGESLTIDLKDFYILFYELVLKLPVENARFVPIALSALELMFYKRKQVKTSLFFRAIDQHIIIIGTAFARSCGCFRQATLPCVVADAFACRPSNDRRRPHFAAKIPADTSTFGNRSGWRRPVPARARQPRQRQCVCLYSVGACRNAGVEKKIIYCLIIQKKKKTEPFPSNGCEAGTTNGQRASWRAW